MDKIYLVLQNGQVYEGQSFGAKAEVVGELVFNTGMCGFLQMLTDKCYQGQIVVDTFPMLGNYGVNDDAKDKQSAVKAVLTREVCDTPSNFRSKGKITDLMADMGVVGMSGIDTRALTRYIRDNGAQKAIICSNPNLTDAQKKALEEYEVVRPISEVCANQSEQVVGKGSKVTLINLGETYDIAEMLASKGCEVTVVTYNTSAKDILETKPQGVVLSSGSDFVSDTAVVENTIKELAKADVSMLGIGLGHALLAKAMGCAVEKTLHGQHGNQPVKKLDTGRLFTTYQNHNMNVVAEDSDDIRVVYRNVNDGSVEGLCYNAIKSMGVAFLPSTNGGPNATDFVYDEFLELTKENR